MTSHQTKKKNFLTPLKPIRMKNNAKLTAVIAERTGVTKSEAEAQIANVLIAIKHIADIEGKLTIQEFGTFSFKDSAARVARNPQTGAPINVPAKRTFVFKAAKK
jgi:nucleoid DNA-binding protein